MSDVAERLEDLRRAGLYRRLRLIEGPQGPRVTLDGAEVLLLCSNNYLGLADHPRVRQAAADAAERFGAGAGASRLISGNMSLHGRLEERLAAFAGYESALLFGSGYLANLGTIAALAGRGQVVFSDELNHASIIDGCRISRAERFVYRHADLEHLSWGLRKEAREGGLIVTDAVFSMDGDVAPIAELLDLARRHGCLLVVDEAHATGALGPGGGGRGGRGRPLRGGGPDRRHARKDAGKLRRLRLREREGGRSADQHRAAVHLLHRAPPSGDRRRARRAHPARRAAREWSSSCAETAPSCATPWPATGSRWAPRAPRSCRWSWEMRGGRWRSASGRWRAGCSLRRSGRRPCPRGPPGFASRRWPTTGPTSCARPRA